MDGQAELEPPSARSFIADSCIVRSRGPDDFEFAVLDFDATGGALALDAAATSAAAGHQEKKHAAAAAGEGGERRPAPDAGR